MLVPRLYSCIALANAAAQDDTVHHMLNYEYYANPMAVGIACAHVTTPNYCAINSSIPREENDMAG